MTQTDLPTSVKRIEGADPERLTTLVAAHEDLLTVLRCCERLVALLTGPQPDDVDVEALWTLTLLSYARLFTADGDDEPALTEDDLVQAVKTASDEAAKRDDAEKAPARAEVDPEKVREWHNVIMHLRDHHADTHTNPRETFTAGVALDPEGAVIAVAVTSVRTPLVDEAAVRQAGTIAYPLIAVLDARINPLQQQVFAAMREVPKHEIEQLQDIEVAAE